MLVQYISHVEPIDEGWEAHHKEYWRRHKSRLPVRRTSFDGYKNKQESFIVSFFEMGSETMDGQS